MPIPTELVGSLPRPMKLQEAYQAYDDGQDRLRRTCRPSRTRPPRTRSGASRRPARPYVTDGEQRESSFATYPITDTLAGTGLADNLAGDGQFFAIFDDGHHRQLPRLTGGPFRYKTFASEFVEKNQAIASKPVKQAVIAPSMLMLLYPLEGEIEGYSREQFLDDLCDEVEKDIRQAFAAGAVRVSIDFTEGRLANKNDSRNPWTNKDMLQEFIDLNNRVIDRFCARGAQEHRHPHLPRRRHGLGALQGGALREAAEQDVPAQRGLLPHPVRERGGQGERLQARAGSTRATTPTACRRSASSASSTRSTRRSRRPSRCATSCSPAAKHIPTERLGATDDCGFSPFSRDEKPKHGSPDFARDIAMQKIANRVKGAAMASEELGV